MYKGELQGFPKEVVDKMLERQLEQRERNPAVFERYAAAGAVAGGFDWDKTPEGQSFWDKVIRNRNFNLFFKNILSKTLILK